uniref:Uncharacterized protein n=1 Tax=Picea sitchensis TaxID=3332 RepID=A9NQM8_PICSI|nr:unknown [Picea sitchensis]
MRSYRMIAMPRGFDRGIFSPRSVTGIELRVTLPAAYSIEDRDIWKADENHSLT